MDANQDVQPGRLLHGHREAGIESDQPHGRLGPVVLLQGGHHLILVDDGPAVPGRPGPGNQADLQLPPLVRLQAVIMSAGTTQGHPESEHGMSTKAGSSESLQASIRRIGTASLQVDLLVRLHSQDLACRHWVL